MGTSLSNNIREGLLRNFLGFLPNSTHDLYSKTCSHKAHSLEILSGETLRQLPTHRTMHCTSGSAVTTTPALAPTPQDSTYPNGCGFRVSVCTSRDIYKKCIALLAWRLHFIPQFHHFAPCCKQLCSRYHFLPVVAMANVYRRNLVQSKRELLSTSQKKCPQLK